MGDQREGGHEYRKRFQEYKPPPPPPPQRERPCKGGWGVGGEVAFGGRSTGKGGIGPHSFASTFTPTWDAWTSPSPPALTLTAVAEHRNGEVHLPRVGVWCGADRVVARLEQGQLSEQQRSGQRNRGEFLQQLHHGWTSEPLPFLVEAGILQRWEKTKGGPSGHGRQSKVPPSARLKERREPTLSMPLGASVGTYSLQDT